MDRATYRYLHLLFHAYRADHVVFVGTIVTLLFFDDVGDTVVPVVIVFRGVGANTLGNIRGGAVELVTTIFVVVCYVFSYVIGFFGVLTICALYSGTRHFGLFVGQLGLRFVVCATICRTLVIVGGRGGV